ncbi:prolyl oligopeptidase family serine peptidase [Saprospira sp. CCB-QB6]|uniref:carboxylesterase family protein n=1 Tax=Saprospira sp. CCB-QB6 TaxID=3023936 RepID=UPI00234B0CAF|nr:prolyl oligopeptidase family serine peptidase [Saprospira sp. CCB-QB6]WCL82545.1 prolyl oligopeptidase family serine peptidase [Saprospira sp. CCB-QB6]
MYKYFFLFLLLTSCTLWGQKDQAGLHAVRNKNLPYEYWTYFPKNYTGQEGQKFPLLIYLHGRSIQGTDLNKVKQYGVIYELERKLELDFIVIAPQCQKGWENDKLIQILDYAEAHYAVDRKKVYLCGMSMGGYGAWHLAGYAPDRFAAVAPIAGGGRLKDVEGMKNLPHFVVHGKKDKPVPVEESRKMVKALKAAGNTEVNYIEEKNWGHSEAVRVFSWPKLYEWFLKYERPIKGEPILAQEDPPKEEPKVPEIKEPQPEEEEYIVFEEDQPKETVKPKPQPKAPKKKKNKWWQFWKWKFWSTMFG